MPVTIGTFKAGTVTHVIAMTDDERATVGQALELVEVIAKMDSAEKTPAKTINKMIETAKAIAGTDGESREMEGLKRIKIKR